MIRARAAPRPSGPSTPSTAPAAGRSCAGMSSSRPRAECASRGRSEKPLRLQRSDLTGVQRDHRGGPLQHGKLGGPRRHPRAVADRDHAARPDDGRVRAGHEWPNDIDFSCGGATSPCRWGDYAGASPDPVNDQAIWGSNQLNGPHTSDPAWLTRNFQLTDAAAGYARPETPLRVALVRRMCRAEPHARRAACIRVVCPTAQVSSLLTVGAPDANGLAASSRSPRSSCSMTGDVKLAGLGDGRAGAPGTRRLCRPASGKRLRSNHRSCLGCGRRRARDARRLPVHVRGPLPDDRGHHGRIDLRGEHDCQRAHGAVRTACARSGSSDRPACTTPTANLFDVRTVI